MSVSFALGIPHTPWRPERARSYDRLRAQLGKPDGVPVATFADREPNWIWSERMWRWACETDVTHFLSLQDDAIVCPEFWRHLRRMVEDVPDQVIGLESVHPRSPEVSDCWYTTMDGLIGVGYVLPLTLLRAFMAWRSSLRKGALETVTEDTLLGLWCFVTGREVWHPLPTLISHDTDLPSTYDNDGHAHRKPLVTWKERELPESWAPLRAPTCFGRFYDATPRLARRWVPGSTEEDFQRWIRMGVST